MKVMQEVLFGILCFMETPISILYCLFTYTNHLATMDIRSLYQKMRRFQERIFYDGYDILSMETEDLTWREMDPFYLPLSNACGLKC